jgi:hypothetical protein
MLECRYDSPPKLRWWVILLASLAIFAVAAAVDAYGAILRSNNLPWTLERVCDRFAFAFYNVFVFGVIIGAIFDLVRWWEWKRRS